MSKYKRSGRPQSSRSKRTTRPRLEVLESRLVLSTISGTVFNDLHVTGAIAANDPGLANRTVFVDLHNDGVLDSGDPSAVTDASGHYVITGVNSGATLRVVTYPGDNPTTPTAVVINANSSTANFGLQPESTILPTTPNPAPFAGGGNAASSRACIATSSGGTPTRPGWPTGTRSSRRARVRLRSLISFFSRLSI